MEYPPKRPAGKTASAHDGDAMLADEELVAQRDALLAREPRLRGRLLADRLGVSEARVLMLERAGAARALRPEWSEIIGAVAGLSRVMAFTRNDWVLHEKIGSYGEVVPGDSGWATVLGEEISLRLFFEQWRFGFAVREGILNSLQFFDRFGAAIHKIYLLDCSDERSFGRLVGAYGCDSEDVQRRIECVPADGEGGFVSASEMERFRADWDMPREIHEFAGLAARYRLQRIQAYQLAGSDRARRLPPRLFGRALAAAAERAVPIVVLIENHGAVQLHAGAVINVSRRGSWLNVVDPTFNLHVFEDAVAETWVVRRLTPRGEVVSVEAVDARGRPIATLLGTRGPEFAEDRQWLDILRSL